MISKMSFPVFLYILCQANYFDLIFQIGWWAGNCWKTVRMVKLPLLRELVEMLPRIAWFPHFSREVTYSNFSDTVLPHKKLLCIAIPAGIKHVSCRYWDLGGCRCRRLQHEVLRERLRDTVYQNCDYRHATCLIPVGRASHRRIARGRRESYKPSERGIVVTNDPK